MRPYYAILRGRLGVLLQYRSAAIAGMFTQVFWGIVNIMIITAFYEQSTKEQPISLEQAIVFIWLGQALLQLIPWSIDKELESLLKNGNVSYELVRPIELYWMWFCRSIAMRVIPTVLRSIPLFAIAGFIGLTVPVSFSAGVAFGVSLFFSSIVTSAMTTLVVISLFWTISGEGIQRLMPHLTVLLTGMVVPLPLFPDWLQTFLSLQPFRAILDIPIRLYTGIIPAGDLFYCLLFQMFWAGFFVLTGKWLLGKAMQRLSIQGG